MIKEKNYTGRFFEDYDLGETIRHATPRTLTEGDRSLYTITELASNTMKKGTLREELVDSFDQADLSLIINSEDIEWDVEKEFVTKNNTIIIDNHEEIMDHLSDKLKPGDIILIMTNRSSVPIREALMSSIGE